jgi:hypothetical protein
MQDSNIPPKFPILWGSGANPLYIRPIPETTATPTAASLQLGFPPATATPVNAGGTPPDIRDFNGILDQLSAWCQWFSAGGPVGYDGTFSTSIGGYMKGTVLAAASGLGNFWLSLVDNNTSDPDTGGGNWQAFTVNASALNTTNGYIKLPVPGSPILQWGKGITTTGNRDLITFPTPFAMACLGIVANEANAVGGWSILGPSIMGTDTWTTTNFRLSCMSTHAISLAGASWVFEPGNSYSYFAWGF